MTLLDFQLVLGRHNIRPPHFASKVSYSASPQAFAEGSCSASLPTMIFLDFEHLRKYTAFIPKRTLMIGKQHWGFQKSFTMSSTRGRE